MFEKLKRNIESAKVLEALDEQLVNALFAPAEKEGVFEFADASWRDPANKYRADSFLDQMLPLSEFYQEANPPLSAALWGIWNAVRYLRRQRSFLSTLGESKKTHDKVFVAVRALVATAAVQFSDGTASTVVTSDAMSNISSYRNEVENAIRNLTSLNQN